MLCEADHSTSRLHASPNGDHLRAPYDDAIAAFRQFEDRPLLGGKLLDRFRRRSFDHEVATSSEQSHFADRGIVLGIYGYFHYVSFLARRSTLRRCDMCALFTIVCHLTGV
jgi:hypothetical protein